MNSPIHFGGVEAAAYTASGSLGADIDSILGGELGMTAEQIAGLRKAGDV